MHQILSIDRRVYGLSKKVWLQSKISTGAVTRNLVQKYASVHFKKWSWTGNLYTDLAAW